MSTAPKHRRSLHRLSLALSMARFSKPLGGKKRGGSSSGTMVDDDADDDAAAEGGTPRPDSPALSPLDPQPPGGERAKEQAKTDAPPQLPDLEFSPRTGEPPAATEEEDEEDEEAVEEYEGEGLCPARWHIEEDDFFVSDIPTSTIAPSPEYTMSGGRSPARSRASSRVPTEEDLPPIPKDGGRLVSSVSSGSRARHRSADQELARPCPSRSFPSAAVMRRAQAPGSVEPSFKRRLTRKSNKAGL